ncbi:hypothetical protein QBC42DRAFT_295218 [Cladorrhinum samala]|uniref:RecF/RecN/SMC N-terminal domain-containing protein n=1 Tax=Cladorrhinum samala TaxID=585594 RepID=A0AAV9HX09_9PEZI|nr:hypothetical protein QBC42DRAFT_295218 [Cladorrhinum samala]
MPSRTINNLEAESSRKRARRVDTESGEDEDVVQVQHARSGLLADTQRKRVRLSTNGESGKNPHHFLRTETPELEDVTPAGDSPEPDTPPKTQYELMRDNGFDHLRNEAADDQRATQRLRMGRPNLLGDNVIAENGILESITCINFMCHTRLQVDLGPLLNFIVGENGSGKSAILTAITLCLGGKASSTNRGGSLKSFVKEGCERSILAVRIKNQGQDAYRPEAYGDSITVERHFSRSGTSGFKVKSVTGSVISSKKQEVDEIVEYFALQVDNPLNVLSQDNARQFLNSSTKAQKYKFFIEGVQLQQLDNDYRLIAENIGSSMAKIPIQEENLKHAQAELEKANRMKESLEGTRKLREKLNDIRMQLAWARVDEHEQKMAERQEKIAGLDAAIRELQQTLAEKDRELEESESRLARYRDQLEQLRGEEETAKEEYDKSKEGHNQLKAELQKIHFSEREARDRLKITEKEIEELEKKIAETMQKLAEADGGLQAQKRQELDNANAQVLEIEKEQEEVQSRKLPLDNKLTDSNKALTQVDDAIKSKKNEINLVKERIRELEGKAISLWAGYDPKMQALVRAIEADSRFETKPIGPLGRHIQLVKPEWSALIEQMLGGNLNGFLVGSSQDAKILTDMISRMGFRNFPPVLIGSKRPLNLEGKEPDEEYDTILRVLKFDSPLVRDQFIIQAAIEQTLLVPQRSRGHEIMFNGAPPRNVKACVCFHDVKRNEGVRLENRGNFSSSPVQPNPRQKPRIRTDDESQMAYYKDSLRQLEADLDDLAGQRRRAQQEVQRCQSDIQRRARDEKTLETRLKQVYDRIDKLKEELEEFDGSDKGLEVYQSHLEELKNERELRGVLFGDLSLKKAEMNTRTEEEKKVVKEKRLLVQDVEARINKIEEKTARMVEKKDFCNTERLDIVKRLNKVDDKKKKHEEYLAVEKAGLEDEVIPMAKRICEHRLYPREGEDAASLQNQYETLEARYKKLSKDPRMDEKTVFEFVTRTVAKFRQLDKLLKDTKMTNEKLNETLSLRLDKWRKFQRYISSQSRANFIYLLSERGFRGKLLLDHERKALDLQVEPDKTEKRAGGRSTKTLSGGEKSFSSICLLLAIWEAMGSPLRCLDEFDVFMDNVNRAISTNMLITAARRSVNRQYIFITPNAIEGRNTLDKDVKIIRLTDPRQQRLPDLIGR